MNKFYLDSCLNSNNYIQNNSVDLFFCDPPYFISGNKQNIDLENGERSDWDCQWNNKEEYYQWTEQWMKLMFNQLKNNGSAYICSAWQHSGDYQKILEKIGFTVLNRITWKRDKGRGSNSNWKSMLEDIWFVVKNENDYTFNINDVKIKKKVIAPYRDENGNPKDWFEDENGEKMRYTFPGNLWDDMVVPFWSMHEVKSYAKTKKTPNNTLTKHNTQKPKDLVKRCILASSNPNDLVVDYFSGSGTTAIACHELNRNYIVFDVNKTYEEILNTRLLNE